MRDTLTRAIRMTRARGLSSTPSAEEMAAALDDAQAMYLTFPIRKLTDVLIEDDYEAGENERITDTSGTATVTYPDTVTGDDGVDRPPQNGAMVEVTATAGSTRKIYISELKTWMPLTDLTLESEQPFGPSHELGVSAMIAARIAGPVLQKEIPPDVLSLSNQGRTSIRAAFRQIYEPTFNAGLISRFSQSQMAR